MSVSLNPFDGSPFLAAANGRKHLHTPVWFMRQAGRSLPEYKAIRGSGSILEAIKQEINRQKHTQWLDEVLAHPTGLKSTVEERQAFIDELRAERDAR